IMSGAPLTDHYAVSRYFVLWAYRSTFLKRRADDDIVLGRVKDYAQPLSKDDEERLEKAGVQFMRPGGRVPSRFAAGIDWMRFHDRQHDQIVEQRWRVVEVPGRLLIGDTPWGPFIPVSPILALLGHQFGPRGTSPVRRLNELTLNAVQCHCARVPAAPRRRRRS
ncbi:MAG: hypothetical protein H6740_04080, partial [Alphaproteobacteria bacterium]|nr:hypothetical protein [Alphaproteobacteria bacterium]